MKRALFALLVVAVTATGQTGSRLADYALILNDDPVAQKVATREALRSSEAQAHMRKLRGDQSGVLAELQRRKIVVAGAAQVLVNAIFVTATREEALTLTKIPGVAHVVRVPRLKPSLDRAVALANVPAAWSAVGGASKAGAGIKIGILDSGIDQNHAGFQDASVTPPAGFPKGDSNYTNNKVIVARSYIQNCMALGLFTLNCSAPGTAADPRYSLPDDFTPRDRMGHGTAIAMIAAGAQNTDPATGITIQGVAPKAFLGNYKIFGSPGVNDFSSATAFIQALQDALADGMDVVTLSYNEGDPVFDGPLDVDPAPGPAGCGGACDVYSDAIEKAIAKGMLVVVSAGNAGADGKNGETLNTILRPGLAPSAITVGATMNSHTLYQKVRTGGGLPDIRALFGNGPQLASPLSAPLKDVAQLGNDGLACTALPAGSLNGSIALIQRGTCFFRDKINNAQAAGAIGAVIYLPSGPSDLFQMVNTETTGIPAVLVSNTDGLSLKSFAANSNGNVTLDPSLFSVDSQPDSVWQASSRGPSPGTFAATQTYVIKPEIAAPGANIFTATQRLDPNGDAYNASGYTTVTGTSFAVPMVAGAVALVKQLHPNFTPAQLKSAVVNTANNQSVTDASGVARVTSVGAGKLSAGDAVNVAATLDPPTIEFGPLLAASLPIRRTLTITNAGTSSATFTFTVKPRDTASATPQVSPSSLTLSPSQQNSVTVTLSGTRPAAGSYEGVIEVTGAGPTLHLPYQFIVPSGIPSDVFPLKNGSFVGGTSDTDWLIALRVTDRSGAPVVGTPLAFVSAGTGTIDNGDRQSFGLGNAGALVNLSAAPGPQIYNASVGGMTLEFDGFARPYPTVNGVLNAASNDLKQGLAPGSYISLYGDSLADSFHLLSTTYLPVSLSGVSVSFDAPGVSVPGHLHFVSPGQVNVQIPWELIGQPSAQIKISIGALQGPLFTVPLALYAPGILEGSGIALAQDSNFVLITPSHPAVRGQGIVIYCNGLGPVANTPPSGEPSPAPPQTVSTTNATPTVSIGGVQAQILFSGLTPGVVGLYQVNVVVPPNAPTGTQDLVLSIGGVTAKTSKIPVQ